MPPPVGMTKTNLQPPRRRDHSSTRGRDTSLPRERKEKERDRSKDREKRDRSSSRRTNLVGAKGPPSAPIPKLRKSHRSASKDRKKAEPPSQRMAKSNTPPPPRARVADFLGTLGDSQKSTTTHRSTASRQSHHTTRSTLDHMKAKHTFSEASTVKDDIPSRYTARRGPAPTPPPPPAPPAPEGTPKGTPKDTNDVDYTALLESSMRSVKEEIDVSSPQDPSVSPSRRPSKSVFSEVSVSPAREKEEKSTKDASFDMSFDNQSVGKSPDRSLDRSMDKSFDDDARSAQSARSTRVQPKTPGAGLSASMRMAKNEPTPVRVAPPAKDAQDTYRSEWQGLVDGSDDGYDEPSPADRITQAVARSKHEELPTVSATTSPDASSLSQIIELRPSGTIKALNFGEEREQETTPVPDTLDVSPQEMSPQEASADDERVIETPEEVKAEVPDPMLPTVQVLQAEVNVHLTTIKMLERDRNQLAGRLQTTEDKNDELRRESRTQEEEYLQMVRAAEIAKGENKTLQNEVQRLRDGVAAGWTEHEALRSKTADALKDKREVEVELIKANSVAAKHDLEVEHFRKETERAVRDQVAAERKAEQLEVQVQALQLELHKQRAYLEEAETKNAEAQEELARHRKGETEELRALRGELLRMDEMKEDYLAVKQELNKLKYASRESEIIETLRTEVRILREREVTRAREDTLRERLALVQSENEALKASPLATNEVKTLQEELKKERFEKHQVVVSSSKALLEGAKEATQEVVGLKEQNSRLAVEVRALSAQLEAAECDREETQQVYWNKLLGKCEEALMPKEQGRRSRERTPYLSQGLGMPPRASSVASNASAGHGPVTHPSDLPSPPRLVGRSPSPGVFTPCPTDPRPASSPPRRVASVSSRLPAAPVLRRC